MSNIILYEYRIDVCVCVCLYVYVCSQMDAWDLKGFHGSSWIRIPSTSSTAGLPVSLL